MTYRITAAAACFALFCVTSLCAQAGCPNAETAKSGYRLIASQRAAIIEVLPFDGPIVTYKLTPKGADPVLVTSQEGLFSLVTRSKDEETKTKYSIDIAKLLPLQMDSTIAFESVSTASDGKQLNSATQQRAVETERISIGECSYDTVVIQSASRFSGTYFQSRRRLNYSPDLKMVIRAEFRANDGRSWVEDYETIESN
jgi:hypothetical protein